MIVDCWAQRIDSRMDATLVVYDAHRPSNWPAAATSTAATAWSTLTVPADGEYVLKVYDFIYAGGPEYFYRLAI